MKILLDENLNWRLERFLPGHDCSSVPRIGWAGITNGLLLQKASSHGFDVVISMDSSLSFQQKLTSLSIPVVVLRARSNRLEDTSPLMPQVLSLLHSLKPCTVTIVG